MEINLIDKYRTRDGHPATVYAVDLRNNGGFCVLAVIHDQNYDSAKLFKLDGLCSSYETCHDLIKVSPYDHLKIDDKILVWNDDNDTKKKRYFAGTDKNGNPLAFNCGTTSWSCDSKISWKYCEKAEE